MEKPLGKDTNALNWFEIPVVDMDRARRFYETIFNMEMINWDLPSLQMVLFPCEAPHSGGALAKSEFHVPSTSGSIIYLNGNPDLQVVLDRIENAGGKIIMPKTEISEDIGFMAFFHDTEGNAVALHSRH